MNGFNERGDEGHTQKGMTCAAGRVFAQGSAGTKGRPLPQGQPELCAVKTHKPIRLRLMGEVYAAFMQIWL
jgi:hypothetical protein